MPLPGTHLGPVAAQLARLIRCCVRDGELRDRLGRTARPFPLKHTREIGERRSPALSASWAECGPTRCIRRDRDEAKGVHPIDVGDETTQCQFADSMERGSEHFLPPVLESLLEEFPFRVRGFHSDDRS